MIIIYLFLLNYFCVAVMAKHSFEALRQVKTSGSFDLSPIVVL